MFYWVAVTYAEHAQFGDGFVHNGVGVVWAEDAQTAFHKASTLYEPYTIISISVHLLELDKIKNVAVKGGMRLVDFRVDE